MDLAGIAIDADPPWSIVVRIGGSLHADPIAGDFEAFDAIHPVLRASCITPDMPIMHV